MIMSRRYGVELEMLVPTLTPTNTLVEAIVAEGVPCYNAGYTHATSAQWKFVSDGSLMPARGTYGVELVSPPLTGEEGFEQIRKVCQVLARFGVTVNRSCGLHVHVDANNLTVDAMRRLAIVYADAEGILDTFMPPSRRGNNNSYCQSVARANKASIARANGARDLATVMSGGSRYAKLNFTSYWRHRTVEFRHHAGTVDAGKVVNWTKMCLRLVNFAATSQVTFATGQVLPVNVRAGTKRALLVEMLLRPNGATRAELLVATGSYKLALGAVARAAGISVRRGRRINGGLTRYYGSRPNDGTPVSPTADLGTANMTFETFCERLALDEPEVTFWTHRRAFLINATEPA